MLAASALGIFVLIVSPPCWAQSESESDRILRALLPNGVWGDASQLARFGRSKEIRVLTEARTHATGFRAIAMTFLLAALGKDYSANRRILIVAMKRCAHKPYPENCRYAIADYLMQLCRRGDSSLLHSIFSVSNKADGAFSQSLGGFYSDMLNDRTKQFLTALAWYSKQKQRALCWDAGAEDGSGMDETRFRRVDGLLNQIAMRRLSIAVVARTCLTGVREGYHQAIANDESTNPK